MGAERLPARFLRRLRARELSPSTVSIHVGTDLDARALGARHDTSVARTWDLERVFADALRARIKAAHVVIPSLTDPALAPAGEHVVMVQGPAARESGESPRDDRRIAEDLLSYAEDVLAQALVARRSSAVNGKVLAWMRTRVALVRLAKRFRLRGLPAGTRLASVR